MGYGGFMKYEWTDRPDILHTLYSVSSLVIGKEQAENAKMNEINPMLAITQDTFDEFFNEKESSL